MAFLKFHPDSSLRSPNRSLGDTVKSWFGGRSRSTADDIFTGEAERHGGMRDAAYATAERPKSDAPLLSSDGKTESMERIELMRESRRLFENVAAVKTAEMVHSRYCAPVAWHASTGDNDVNTILTNFIAKEMEAERFDLAQEHDLPSAIRSANIDWGIDGDVFGNMLRPRDEFRFRTQFVRAHRVGPEKDQIFDVSNELSDLFGLKKKQRFREVSGIVLDSLDRRRAIRVYPANRDPVLGIKDKVKTIPWNQILHLYDPLKTDRIREATRWNTSIPELVDLEQIWRYLKATLKNQVAAPIVEKTKTGTARKSTQKKPSLDGTAEESTSDEAPLKEVKPGQYQYLRVGETIADFQMQRPNATFFECVEYLLRSGAWAFDCPYPFIFDSKGLNGGTLRLENSKAGASFSYYRRRVSKRLLDPWVRAKILEGIRTGELPYKASQLSDLAQGKWAWPELPTADEKYHDQTTISLFNTGLCSGQDVVSPKGTTIEAVQDQKQKENLRVAELATKAHEKFPHIPLQWWLDKLSMSGANGSAAYVFEEAEKLSTKAGAKNSGDRKTKNRLAAVEQSVSGLQTAVTASNQKTEELSEQLELFEFSTSSPNNY